jgi:polyphosphate glucokinase
VTLSAANIDHSWIGMDAQSLISKLTKCPVVVLNDADAAGMAEMAYGAGKNQNGLVLIVTLGTGIGTALFYRGVLVPNTELGHLELDGKDSERRCAESARVRKDLSWKKWGANLNTYFQYLERLFTPDLFIVGGGVSKKADKFLPFIQTNASIVPAKSMNDAGIVGAAMAAYEATRKPSSAAAKIAEASKPRPASKAPAKRRGK